VQRVIVFRKIVMKDKEALGILESNRMSPQSTLISVHRSRIIEVCDETASVVEMA